MTVPRQDGLREALSWALDSLELCFKRLDSIDTYSDEHFALRTAGLTKARAALAADDQTERLRDALDQYETARRDITATLIALKPRLEDPYPDDPRWTPWTRFVERSLRRLEHAGQNARAALSGSEESQT